MTEKHSVGTMTIRDREIPVKFAGQRFWAEVDGKTIHHETWQGLYDAAMKHSRATAIVHAIPFIGRIAGNHRYERMTLRGFTERTREYKITRASGAKESYSNIDVLAKGDEVTDDQLAALNAAADTAEQARAKYEQIRTDTMKAARKASKRDSLFIHLDHLLRDATAAALANKE